MLVINKLKNQFSNLGCKFLNKYSKQKQNKATNNRIKLSPRRLEIGTIFNAANHYTEEYYNGAGLEYMTPNGTWDIYYGPAPTWEGFYLVAEMLEEIIDQSQGRKLLDIGCSYGDFVRKAVQKGWDAYGVDISANAVQRSHPDVRERIICADIVCPNESLKTQAPFDVITSWDFWEHIYESDLDQLIDGLFKLLRPGGVMFNIICTSARNERDFVLKKGGAFTKENSGLLCSGHITIHRWNWWVNKFLEHGYVVDYNLAYLFQVARSENQLNGFANLLSWSPRNLVVIRKPFEEIASASQKK
jgi:2-polyprenyl-3-methyl-5-hydroxy-6-metoxy-1,4-benzoquinol methylase